MLTTNSANTAQRCMRLCCYFISLPCLQCGSYKYVYYYHDYCLPRTILIYDFSIKSHCVTCTKQVEKVLPSMGHSVHVYPMLTSDLIENSTKIELIFEQLN